LTRDETTILWAAHLLAVVLWIGALAFVMTVLQAAARCPLGKGLMSGSLAPFA